MIRICFVVGGALVGHSSSAQAADPPASGKAVPGYEPLDKAVLKLRERLGATAATAAVSRNGELIYSRGFGWSDQQKTKPVQPDALFRLGSVTKAFTAAAIREAVLAGSLNLDDPAFDYVKARPPGGKPADDRVAKITVRQLLEHKAGWQDDPAHDPLFSPREIAKTLKLNRPPGPADAVAFMLTHHLDFTPGAKTAYSNVGYTVLGRVLEGAQKKPTYGEALQELVLKPAGITDVRVASTKRDPREVAYPLPPDLFRVELLDSTSGLAASAPAVCRFLEKYWLSGDKRQPGVPGEGVMYGSIPGTTALARQRKDGLNVVVLLNARRDKKPQEDVREVRATIDEAMDEIAKKK